MKKILTYSLLGLLVPCSTLSTACDDRCAAAQANGYANRSIPKLRDDRDRESRPQKEDPDCLVALNGVWGNGDGANGADVNQTINNFGTIEIYCY